MKLKKEELIDLGIAFVGLFLGSVISDALGLVFWLHPLVSLIIICVMNLTVKSFDRHLTVTRLLPPGVHVYSDRSNPLLIISFVAFAVNVSRRKTSYW